ncbi:MAG: hypothetical protein HC871_13360 [Rhizobiales bacterium]|nr:hypothetical protein [Hyphomicrobiales bacterium]
MQIAWFFSPDGIVDHIPETVRIGAFAVATAWLLGLIHAFRSLPKVIDEIMDRGIVSIDRPGADPGRSARQFRRLDLI